MNWFPSANALFFENARIVDALRGETPGTLRLIGGRIDGINTPSRKSDTRFDLAGAWVIPGLINAHDHLELNNFPRWKNRPGYANAREWAAQANARLDTDPAIVAARRVPLAERLFIGGLKNLLAGTTTVAHHNPYHAPLRNHFPVRVVARYGWSHSLYLAPDFAPTYHRTPRSAPFMIHLAEGTDAEARQELARLDAAGALDDNTVLIHGVGLGESERARAIQKRAALVWCPASNFFLLNATAQVRDFSDAHLLALGSDSRLTGERDLLAEVHIARATQQLSQEALLRAVTTDSARILRLKDVGRIACGMRADLIILPAHLDSPAEALGNLARADLRAVILNGVVRIADPDFALLIKNPARILLDGREKILAPDLVTSISRLSVGEPGLTLA